MLSVLGDWSQIESRAICDIASSRPCLRERSAPSGCLANRTRSMNASALEAGENHYFERSLTS